MIRVRETAQTASERAREAIRAGTAELDRNPRARSATLRAAA